MSDHVEARAKVVEDFFSMVFLDFIPLTDEQIQRIEAAQS